MLNVQRWGLGASLPLLNPFHVITNVVRAKEITTVLIRNGFLELLEQIEAPSSWISRFVPPRPERLNLWQRIRVTAEELGPIYVKFAQVLSARPDVLPQPLIDELKKLRNQVKPEPWEAMRPVLERELEGAIEDNFTEFNSTPVAAGSIAQVYRAKLKSGESVAIKLQRPGIRKEIKTDLGFITWFAQKMHDHLPDLRPYNLPEVVAEAGEGIMRELDFTIEARNSTYFNTINPSPKEVFAPQVFEQFTSRRLLVLEWVEGTAPGMGDLAPEVRAEMARIGGRSVFHQAIIAGFFHADPHTGNLLVTPDGRLCFIDWGLAGQLTRHMRYFLADLFSAVASQNPERVVQVTLANALTKRRIDNTRLEKDVSFVLRRYQRFDAGSEAVGRVIIDLLYVFGTNGIQLARDYALLAKAVIAIEEAGKTFDPTFDIRSISEPYLRKLSVERWHPKTLASLAYWDLRAAFRHVGDIPGTLQRLLHNFEEGEGTINFVHRGLDDIRTSFESGVNRLVLAIIIAALLLSSSITVSRVEPGSLLYVFSNLGFVLATFFGFWLLYETIRHVRRK